MQTVDTPSKFIEGIFVQELKNRFLCEVLIDGVPTVCYVPSSCHLGNFLDLRNKKVLLVRTQTPKSRTQYALFAIPYKKSQIILNTSMANSAVANSVHGRRFSYLGPRKTIFKEHRIDEYKADLYIKDTNTIIEIKSIISTNKTGVFPTVYSERTLNQLKKIQYLLSHGYKVCFIIVSLNPYVSEIEIDKQSEFFKHFKTCINQGMIVKGYACSLVENCLKISKGIEIKL